MSEPKKTNQSWSEFEWNNPPAPFNPKFDPKANARFEKVTDSMERDDYYANHTREECKAEWARRYDELKERGQ